MIFRNETIRTLWFHLGDTVLRPMAFKRNINVYIGALDVKLPENNDREIVRFRGSFECISKVLSIKDKLIYLIVSNTLGKSVVPLIHKHRCLEYVYILQNTDRQDQVNWTKDYSKVRISQSSVEQLLQSMKDNIDSLMQRPSRWSRSKKLLTELCMQTDLSITKAIPDVPKEDLRMLRIMTLFFGTRRPFSRSSSQIQIDEFNTVDECVQTIQANTSITVFLVIFLDGFNDICSLFELENIHAVYIVCNGNWNEQLETISQHSKVSGMFGLDEDLLKQLTTDICFYRHMQVHTPMINNLHIGSNFTN